MAQRVAGDLFINDKTKNGWSLIEHTPRRVISVRDLELGPFLKLGESYVSGEEMVRRARVELDANYGQEDAEYLLGHRGEIPAEFRSHVLVFTATVWLDVDRSRRVAYLRWSGESWASTGSATGFRTVASSVLASSIGSWNLRVLELSRPSVS